jgi:putative membrane protein
MKSITTSVALVLLAAASVHAQAPALSLARSPSHAVVAAALDDPTIVAIFDAANSWDIETGQLALKKSKNKDVLAFADMMVKDHTAVRKLGRDLAAKLKVTPTPPGKDFALYIDHVDAMKALDAATGAAFDKAYIDHEVTYHQAVIDAVTKQLLPATKNAELRDLENKVAPNFVAHLAAGTDVQAKLKK